MIKKIYHFCLAFLGALIYKFPSRQIFVAGVTGTKGKSTTIELINAILEAAGKKTALISSVRIKIADESEKNLTETTMPGRFFIQKFLKKSINAGCEYALIEVTSQGINQSRHRFINWDAALFTNLAPEHIEAHGGFEKYQVAKLSFFRYVSKLKTKSLGKLFFINHDDPHAQSFIKAAENGKIILYSKKDVIDFKFQPPDSLIGDFNLENIAAAISFGRTLGVDDEIIKRALENFKGVPGRMETVQTQPFRVIIDYAHTPDSLMKIYQTVKSKFQPPNSKLICVFGSAGGGRDKWKRPKMGEIAAKYCDEIILTNEDPYDENPLDIIRQIFKGIESASINHRKPAVYKILDRTEAIKKAISLAKKDDVVIFTGKGSEPYMHLEKGKKIPWDEKQVVKSFLQNIIEQNKK